MGRQRRVLRRKRGHPAEGGAAVLLRPWAVARRIIVAPPVAVLRRRDII